MATTLALFFAGKGGYGIMGGLTLLIIVTKKYGDKWWWKALCLLLALSLVAFVVSTFALNHQWSSMRIAPD